jgi:hypothetical protein
VNRTDPALSFEDDLDRTLARQLLEETGRLLGTPDRRAVDLQEQVALAQPELAGNI